MIAAILTGVLALLAGLWIGFTRKPPPPPPQDSVDARSTAGDKALHDAQVAASATRDPSALAERVRQLRERATRKPK